MNLSVAIAWVQPPCDEHQERGQRKCLEGLGRFDLTGVLWVRPADQRVSFPRLLSLARCHAESGWLMWINSDCEFVADPRPYLAKYPHTCIGFHAHENGPNAPESIRGGVDGYAIACSVWDRWLGVDPPDMRVGATHIDWWVSRTAEKCGVSVDIHDRVLVHHTHPKRGPCTGGQDPIYRHNRTVYEHWAKQHELRGA